MGQYRQLKIFYNDNMGMKHCINGFFKKSFKKEWYKTYWAFDIHSTILISNHSKEDISTEFYPYAKETLQLLSKRKDIVMIIFSSATPEKLTKYKQYFKDNSINFDYINENPEITTEKNFGNYDQKFYYDLLFEDKAGFQAYREWKEIYTLLKSYEQKNYLPNPEWTTKY